MRGRSAAPGFTVRRQLFLGVFLAAFGTALFGFATPAQAVYQYTSGDNRGDVQANVPISYSVAFSNISNGGSNVPIDTVRFTMPAGFTVNSVSSPASAGGNSFNVSRSGNVVTGVASSSFSRLAIGESITITASITPPNAPNAAPYTVATAVTGVGGTPTFALSGSGLQVTVVNTAPVANSFRYDVTEDVTYVSPTGGVLRNDTDANNPTGTNTPQTITAELVTAPTMGTLTLNANGSFTFVPNANANGTDVFYYRVFDGYAYSNTTTTFLDIAAVNDAPVATADAYSLAEDSGTFNPGSPGILINDADVENSTLTSVLVTGPSNGTFTLASNGSFAYNPTANFNGTDSFTYRANDGTANSNSVTVTLTVTAVNDAPIATADAYTLDEDTNPFNPGAPGVLANDNDVENSTLTAVLVAGPSNGTLILATNGSFTYAPAANFNGSDSFTYKANDGDADSETVTVSLTITPVNDDPIAVADSYTLTEDDNPYNGGASVLDNDTDVDNTLTAILVSDVTNGTLTLATNGSFAYTPNANYFGNDSFTYKANDGTVDSNTVTVSLAIASVNDVPVATVDDFTLNEDSNPYNPGTSVLANDSDVENSNLTAVLVEAPLNGTLILATNGSFAYTPTPNFFGADVFTYKANDGDADSNIVAVNLTVTNTPDAPKAVNDTYEATEDSVLTIEAPGVIGNDTDVDGDILNATIVTGASSGTVSLNANGSFVFTPAANDDGTATFTYRVSDGALDSNTATVFINIASINDVPVAVDDSYTLLENSNPYTSTSSVLANDTDADLDTLRAQLVSAPSNGTVALASNGNFTYRPDTGYFGTDSFTYQARDVPANALSNIVTVTLNVTPLNRAPVSNNDSYTTAEDVPLEVSSEGVLANDTDADSNPLTASVVTGPTQGTLSLNPNGTFTYTPAANYNGTDSFTYKANDGTVDGNTATVTITITAVNDSPIAVNDSYTLLEDANPFNPGSSGRILLNDSDSDTAANQLTAVLVTGPTRGTLTLALNGSFAYRPTANYNGPDSFTYKVTDGNSDSNVATVSLTITAVNDAPVAQNNAYTTDKNLPITVAAPGVLGNDTDNDGDTLTAAVVTNPSTGSVSFSSDGSFTFTPGLNFVGAVAFTYRANDGTVNSNTASVTFTVRQTYTITGLIRTAESTPVAGVSVAISPVPGGTTTPVVTNASGAYTLSNVPAGTYTLTATKANTTFEPSSQSVTVTTGNKTADFTAIPIIVLYQVSGRIANSAGVGIVGATVMRSGTGTTTATSNGAGYYTFNGVPNGTYTVTPSMSGTTFSPASRSVTVADGNVANVNFVTGFSIVGRIIDTAGAALAGRTVSLNTGETAVTNATGNFTFNNIVAGTYTLTPDTSGGYNFTPISRSVTVSTANVSGQNFTAATGYAIAGRLSTSNGVGIVGVTVTLSNSQTAVSNGAGYYLFNSVPDGSYTITPNPLSGYNFTPGNRGVTMAGANQSNFNFIGTPTG